MDPPDITPNGIANSAEAYTLRDFLKRGGMSFDWKELLRIFSWRAPYERTSISNMSTALTCTLKES
jgi:hypothetical protein